MEEVGGGDGQLPLNLSAACPGSTSPLSPHWLLLQVLTQSGFGPITTEIVEAKAFYYAEDSHQQYLSKVPDGYCSLKGTGVSCPLGLSG